MKCHQFQDGFDDYALGPLPATVWQSRGYKNIGRFRNVALTGIAVNQ